MVMAANFFTDPTPVRDAIRAVLLTVPAITDDLSDVIVPDGAADDDPFPYLAIVLIAAPPDHWYSQPCFRPTFDLTAVDGGDDDTRVARIIGNVGTTLMDPTTVFDPDGYKVFSIEQTNSRSGRDVDRDGRVTRRASITVELYVAKT